MTDITKCTGYTIDSMRLKDHCPMRHKCYRFTAKDGAQQSYFAVTPMYTLSEGGAVKCDEFVNNKK